MLRWRPRDWQRQPQIAFPPWAEASCRLVEAEQPFRIAVRDAFPVSRRKRQTFEKRAPFRHRPIRIVDREDDPPDTNLEQQILERCRKVESAERVMNVL